MYQTFYGFHQKPFSLFPDHRLLFLNTRCQLALNLLEFGLLNQNGIILLTGDPGTGKTTLVKRILHTLDSTIVAGLFPFTSLKGSHLLPWVLQAFGLPCSNQFSGDQLKTFVDFLAHVSAQGKQVLLIVDEAQNLDVEKLEELRLLFNLNDGDRPVFQILLSGHSQLREQLEHPQLQAFVQRVGTDFCLEPFNQQDTRAYILHRIQAAGGSVFLFSEKACELVYHCTKGNPRLINQLCDISLVYGFSDQAKAVTEHYVAQAAKDRMAGGLLPLAQDELGEWLTIEHEEPAPQGPVQAIRQPYVEALRKPEGGMPDFSLHWEKGVALQKEGWCLEAIQSFKQAAASAEYHWSAWYQIGQCYQSLGRSKEVLEAFRTAISSPGLSLKELKPLHYALGQVLENLGELEEAHRYFQLARSTDQGVNLNLHKISPMMHEQHPTPKWSSPATPHSWLLQLFKRMGQFGKRVKNFGQSLFDFG